jgi:tetratricopeptide (TPR) repeat protein
VKSVRRLGRVLVTLLTLTLLGFAGLSVIGSIRYGGADMLVRRVRAEIATYRPHPERVPTPLSTVPVGKLVDLANTSWSGVSPSPSPTKANALATESLPTRASTEVAPSPSAPTPTQTVPPTAPSPPSATPTPAYVAAAESVQLAGLAHMWQTWNNCGPATLAMNLSYYACDLGQSDVAAALRPDKDDKNVSPEELATFARSQGLFARVLVNGDSERLRLLLSNGVPVLIETWHEPEPNNGMGHYRLLVGYDSATQEWIAYDSYDSKGVDTNQPYAGIRLPYESLDSLWRVFNRVYLVVYDAGHAPAVEAILDGDLDEATMWQQAILKAQTELQERPGDAFPWFNAGTGFAALGQFERAAAAFDHARQIGLPWRMLWYQFGPFQAYYEVGRYAELIALADATLKTADNIEELHFWKGKAYYAEGNLEAARLSWQRALELNAFFAPAGDALASLDATPAP